MERRDRHVVELRKQMLAAAITLQCAARRFLASAYTKLRRKVYHKACTILQRSYRKHLQAARWKKGMSHMVGKKRWKQAKNNATAKLMLEKANAHRVHAVNQIRRVYQRHYQTRIGAAVKLQGIVRGIAARVLAYKTKWGRFTKARLHRWAVQWKIRKKHAKQIRLAAWWRGWLVRRRPWAARVLQRQWRSNRMNYYMRKYFGFQEVALFMQCRWRGRRVPAAREVPVVALIRACCRDVRT